MKPYQYNLKVWEGGETSRTWQFGIINNRSLLWVNYEFPGGIIHSTGGINILLSFFGSSLFEIELQQRKFSLAVAFFTEYFDGWSND